VLLDSDLAELYGVTTKRLNEQVRRNPVRFPPDFVFQLTDQEFGRLRSQFATSNIAVGRGGRRYLSLRQTLAAHRDLASKLEALEKSTEALAMKHDALAKETHAQFKAVIEALRRLMSPSVQSRRSIGFVTLK